jgi:hypothetical protein
MNRKKHVISSFIKFIAEKYSKNELEDNVLDEIEDEEKSDYEFTDEQEKDDDDKLSNKEMKEDLLDIIQEYKKRYEK